MAALELTCLVYINPEGISSRYLRSIKNQITGSAGGSMADVVYFEECTLPYRNLLAMAQSRAGLQDVHCFFILDRNTADEGAVLCVETKLLPL